MTEYNYTKEEYMSLRKAFLRYHYRGEYNYADFLFPESIPVFLKIADKERNIDEGKVKNDREFWEDVAKRVDDCEAIALGIIQSKYVPLDIEQSVILKINDPKILIHVLSQDKEYDTKIYDHVAKKAKNYICEDLMHKYRQYAKEPIGFSQRAINYYGIKSFNKPNVKNDKMLILAAYVNDKDFLATAPSSPLLNETRLNYLINNENIDEDIRNKMFTGENTTDMISPDQNKINNPTKFMIEQIYLLNIESYFCATGTDKNKIQNNVVYKIQELENSGLLTEGIEKDILERYTKNDAKYRSIIKSVLLSTRNIGTIEYAKKFDYRISDPVFRNKNITDEQYRYFTDEQFKKIGRSIKRTGNMPTGNWNVMECLKRITLSDEQYNLLLSTKSQNVYEALAFSAKTPENVLKEIVKNKFSVKKVQNYYGMQKVYPTIDFLAYINLTLRKMGFSNESIENYTPYFRQYSQIHNYKPLAKNEFIEGSGCFQLAKELDTLGKEKEFVKAINKYSLNPTTKEIWKNFSIMLEDYHFAKEANKTFDVNKNTKWFLRNYLDEHTQNIEASTVNEFCEKAMKESERIIKAEEKIEEYSKAELGNYYMK